MLPDSRRNGLPREVRGGMRAAPSMTGRKDMSDTLRNQIHDLIGPFNKQGVAQHERA